MPPVASLIRSAQGRCQLLQPSRRRAPPDSGFGILAILPRHGAGVVISGAWPRTSCSLVSAQGEFESYREDFASTLQGLARSREASFAVRLRAAVSRGRFAPWLFRRHRRNWTGYLPCLASSTTGSTSEAPPAPSACIWPRPALGRRCCSCTAGRSTGGAGAGSSSNSAATTGC
jgi:hypothetical protein